MLFNNQYASSILKQKEAIYICDDKGYIKLYNNAAANLWGREPEVSKDLYCGALKLFNKNGEEVLYEEYPVVKIIKEGKAIEAMELIVQRPDGSYKKIMQSSTPMFNVGGELTGAVNLLIDITDAK
jgi:PAS domain S-box-containing protein